MRNMARTKIEQLTKGKTGEITTLGCTSSFAWQVPVEYCLYIACMKSCKKHMMSSVKMATCMSPYSNSVLTQSLVNLVDALYTGQGHWGLSFSTREEEVVQPINSKAYSVILKIN